MSVVGRIMFLQENNLQVAEFYKFFWHMGKSHHLCLSSEEVESTNTFLKNLGVPNTTQMMKNILAGRLSVSWIGNKEKRYIISNVKTMKKKERNWSVPERLNNEQSIEAVQKKHLHPHTQELLVFMMLSQRMKCSTAVMMLHQQQSPKSHYL